LRAADANATWRPSEEIAGFEEKSSALAPAAPPARLTSVVVAARRSRRKTCESPFVSVAV
jgi:hypothetical protein